MSRCLVIWTAVDKMLQEADVGKRQAAVGKYGRVYWHTAAGGEAGNVRNCD